MSTFYKYTYTHPGGTGTVVAGSAKYAREKVWHRWSHGLPFQGFGPGDIRVKRGERVILQYKESGMRDIPEMT